MSRNRSRALLAPLSLSLSLGLCGLAAAQTVSIDFTNADLPPIKLLDGTSVAIDGQGNLKAQCVLDGDVCEGITTEEPIGPVPVVNLARTGTGNISTGGSLALTWGVQNAAEICVATSSPAVTGWNNAVVTAAGGNTSLTMPTAGTYSLGLKCYNQHGSGSSQTVSVTVEGSQIPTQIPACHIADLNESGRVQPAGFTGKLVSWPSLFYGAEFPQGPSHLSPVGSFTLRAESSGTRGPTMNGRYLTTSFVAQANKSYSVSWLGAQPVRVLPAVDYTPARVAHSVFVSVSPCAGDLRGQTDFSTIDLKICRGQLSSGSLKFGTVGGTGQCPLVAGQTYFLNIAFIDAAGTEPLSTTVTTCAVTAGNRCEANFNASGSN